MSRKTNEGLPFTIRAVRTDQDLRKALDIRFEAYRRHFPDFGGDHVAPESYDLEPNSTLLLAESKADGMPLGSMRVMTNDKGRLFIEDAIALPAVIRDQPTAEATRLAVKAGRSGTLVKLMLWKAFHRFCLATQMNQMLVAAREPIDKQYEWLGFADPVDGGLRTVLGNTGNAMHRVLTLGVFEAQTLMVQNQHQLYEFFFVESHPEIETFSSVSSRWNAPRRRREAVVPSAATARSLVAELPTMRTPRIALVS